MKNLIILSFLILSVYVFTEPLLLKNSSQIFQNFNSAFEKSISDNNITNYFNSSKHLKYNKDYLIDFFYHQGGPNDSSTFTIVYTRKVNEKSFNGNYQAFIRKYPVPDTTSDYETYSKSLSKYLSDRRNSVCDNIIIDGSTDGYFEFALFYLFHDKLGFKKIPSSVSLKTMNCRDKYIDDFVDLPRDVNPIVLDRIRESKRSLKPTVNKINDRITVTISTWLSFANVIGFNKISLNSKPPYETNIDSVIIITPNKIGDLY